MTASSHGLARFVPDRMRSGRGRNVSLLAAFATVAAAVTFLWARGRRRIVVAH